LQKQLTRGMEQPGRRSLTTAELYGEFEDGTTGTTKLDYSWIVWRVRGWNNRDDEAWLQLNCMESSRMEQPGRSLTTAELYGDFE